MESNSRPRPPPQQQEEKEPEVKTVRLKTLAVIVVSCLIAGYTSFTLLFFLTLQGDMPFVNHPPNGRCDKFFTHMSKLAEASTFSDSLFGYRYDAGHSAAMMCTNEPLQGIVDIIMKDDPKKTDLPKVFDPWAYAAVAWSKGCNLTGWSRWAARIGPNTTVQCPTSGPLTCGLPKQAPFPDPLVAHPSPLMGQNNTNAPIPPNSTTPNPIPANSTTPNPIPANSTTNSTTPNPIPPIALAAGPVDYCNDHTTLRECDADFPECYWDVNLCSAAATPTPTSGPTLSPTPTLSPGAPWPTTPPTPPAPPIPTYAVSSGRNGPWWSYAITFGLTFGNATDCGLDTPSSITLVKNDLPVCDKKYVWAFDHNEKDLILYYKIITIAFFVPHIMYMYYAVRFWKLVGTDDAHAAVFRDDGAVGFGAILFFIYILLNKLPCCRGHKKMPAFAAFVEKYQSPDAKMFDGDCLPPKRIIPFVIDVLLSMVESSFTVIALWGCNTKQLSDWHLLLLEAMLVCGRTKQREKFEKAAAEHGDLRPNGGQGNTAPLINSPSINAGAQQTTVMVPSSSLNVPMVPIYQQQPQPGQPGAYIPPQQQQQQRPAQIPIQQQPQPGQPGAYVLPQQQQQQRLAQIPIQQQPQVSTQQQQVQQVRTAPTDSSSLLSNNTHSSGFPPWMSSFPAGVTDDAKANLQKEQIGEAALLLMDDADLKELGIAFGPRKVLVNEIAKRNATGAV